MKRNRWWWFAALAATLALAVPAAYSIAQTADDGDDDELIAEIEDSLDEWGGGPGMGLHEPGGPQGPHGPDGELGPHMRHGRMGRGGGGHGGMHGRHGGQGMHGRHGGGRLGMMLHQLDLTDAQQKRIQELHEAQARKNIQARADLEIAQMDLHKLMRAETLNRRSIEAQIDKIGSMRTALKKAQVGVMLDVHGLLTDEQKTQLKELRQNKGPGRLHRRPAPPDGPGEGS